MTAVVSRASTVEIRIRLKLLLIVERLSPRLSYRGSSKEDLAECSRLLALNLAHYQGKFGEIPLEDTLAALGATEPNDEQAVLLGDGMEIFLGLLGSVLSGLGEEKH